MKREDVAGFSMILDKNHVLTIDVYNFEGTEEYTMEMDLYDNMDMAGLIDSIGEIFVSEQDEDIKLIDVLAASVEQGVMRFEDI